jgi:GTP-binding protein EngB required for normal cell division
MDIKSQAQAFIEKWVYEDSKKVKIAFFGQPGAGKSSLINELVGEKVAITGSMTDTTRQAQIIEYNEVIFVDLPGYDTSEFPVNKYFTQFNPLQYDLFICVFSGKLQQADIKFFKTLTRAKRQCIFVRNKEDSLYAAKKTLAAIKEEITDDVCHQLTNQVKVLFTSCKKNLPVVQRGISELQEEIIFCLEPALGDKFLRNVKAYTKSILAQKKQEAAKAINKAMIMAAGNGLNPLFGVDVGIDAKIMSIMYERIRKLFEISEEEINTDGGRSHLLKLIARGIKKDTIIKGLETVMSKEMKEKMSKYIPVIGQVTAMSLGAGTMYYLGMEYLDVCYEYAQKRLEEEIKMRVQ